MKNDETGEFELVLGNRQLLSGFFVVVILFAVFFVMGYLVGRNTSPSPARAAALDSSASSQPAANPAPVDTHPQPVAPSVPAQNPPAAAATDTQAANPSKPAADQPPADQPAKPPAAANPAADASSPAPGETYLQVVSVGQHDAELVARTLKDKGFPSSLSPGPNNRTRVLVGPYTEVGALGKAKADLENLGFHPIVKR
jgi:cell division septation protein DedD